MRYDVSVIDLLISRLEEQIASETRQLMDGHLRMELSQILNEKRQIGYLGDELKTLLGKRKKELAALREREREREREDK